MRHRLPAIALAVLCSVAAPTPAAAETEPPPVTYAPPVPGAVVDDWRPPDDKWGAGNRGVDFDAAAGDAVVASADGEVVFAGPVAGSLHVVVLHRDGLRTSYSFLADIHVRRGERVTAGGVVGIAGGPLHFGVRAGDTYLDPLTVLGTGPPRVHLVDDDARPASVAEERGMLERFVRAGRRLAGQARAAGATWVRSRVDRALLPAEYVGEHNPIALVATIGAAAYRAATRQCTPAGAVTPPPPSGRRILVRVAGLGSHTGTAVSDEATNAGAIADVDGRALGYASDDDVQFSYAGGTTRERSYTGDDTHQPIRESGARLSALLDRVAAAHPGVPIDVVAHSMGGLVTRAALTTTRAPVAHVVTFATPHHGADGATAARTLGVTPVLDAPSVADLAEGSAFLDWLDDHPLPDGVAFTSVAARGDVAVPVPRAHLEGATNVVVSPDGWNDHDALPGSPEAARAAALALAGAPPPCERVLDAIVDAAAGEAISAGEDAIAGIAAAAVP